MRFVQDDRNHKGSIIRTHLDVGRGLGVRVARRNKLPNLPSDKASRTGPTAPRRFCRDNMGRRNGGNAADLGLARDYLGLAVDLSRADLTGS
jgi:hypothetical protein